MRGMNILIVMADQLTPSVLGYEGGSALTPHLDALAARSRCYEAAWCASPLCAPSRFALLSGQRISRIGAWDNAAYLPSTVPTFAHYLRAMGYRTSLAGKMHFVGPDQLHGFEERLTTDIYPADFGWTPDWRRPGERIDWWYHNLGSVTGAGTAEITNQLEYDDEVAHFACAKLYDLARGHDARPWCLTVSFTHPHDPYVARRKFWDLYADSDHLAPEVPAMDDADHDPHSRRILDACDGRRHAITEADVARARRGYFANISYLDEKIGEIIGVLEATGQEAVVVFLSDHGDMLGERGLWFKMSMFEGSSRVPLMISATDLAPARVDVPVSTLDLGPTLAALAGIDLSEIADWTDGVDLAPVAAGAPRPGPVAIEYAAEASVAPIVALREGRWKYIRCPADPAQLFDLEADPHEMENLAEDPRYADTLVHFRGLADARWQLDRFDADVRASQARRLVVYDALRRGGYYPWDFQPLRHASERYMRNHLDLNDLEERQRFPRGD